MKDIHNKNVQFRQNKTSAHQNLLTKRVTGKAVSKVAAAECSITDAKLRTVQRGVATWLQPNRTLTMLRVAL